MYVVPSLLAAAFVAALLSLFGDDSFARMQALERSLKRQKEQNAELDSYVRDLRAYVRALRTDDRTLERAARRELGLARPNELIVTFED